MKYIFLILFALGLWYLIFPDSNFSSFLSLAKSVKVSQTPDQVTYYTNNRRSLVTEFYKNEYEKQECGQLKQFNLLCFLKPLKLNHPPELATTFFQPKQQSTYLEEYSFFLRDSLVVNGYEPYDQNGKPFNKYSVPLEFNGKNYSSMVTVRYISSSVFSRILVYILIWLSIYLEIKLFKKILNRNKK